MLCASQGATRVTGPPGVAVSDSKSFRPVAVRELVHVSKDGYELPVYLAVSAPYFPAETEGMEAYAGCLVQTCDDPDLAVEMFGADEMEALLAGLEYIELFLANVLKVGDGGELRTTSGQPFDPSGSVLLKESRRRRANRRTSALPE
jgi:hypothetical protein